MNAIPTTYAGVRFRSRLEARWAVFFDSLGIDWRYEHEGHAAGRWYLCDFYLPEFDVWIEIKPCPPTEDEIAKCVALAAAVPGKVRLLYGVIGWWRSRAWHDPAWGGGIGFWREHDGTQWIAQPDAEPPLYCPCLCPECGRFGVEYRGAAYRIGCGHVTGEKLLTGDDKRIQIATAEAANFQFERESGPAAVTADIRGL